MRALLNHPTFTHRVTYVQGSLDMSVDLERCRADLADAAFLLADKMPMREEEQHRRDLLTISNVLTLKSFNKRLQLFVQLLRPENKAFMHAMPDWCEHIDSTQPASERLNASRMNGLSGGSSGGSSGGGGNGGGGTEGPRRADRVVCITELASSLLALSAIAPGASTLCVNLFSTHRCARVHPHSLTRTKR